MKVSAQPAGGHVPPWPRAGGRRPHAPRAVVHDDDEGFGLAFGDQIVHDQIGLALIGPARLIFAAAVLEVQHGIAGRGVLVIGRRRVDEAPPRGFGDLRIIEILADLAVGDILEGIEVLVLGGAFHAAAPAAGPVEVQAAGVRNGSPVDPDLVVVKAFVLRFGFAAGPDAFLVLGQGVFHGSDVELDLLGLGRGDAGADPPVRGDLGILLSRLIEGRGPPIVGVRRRRRWLCPDKPDPREPEPLAMSRDCVS